MAQLERELARLAARSRDDRRVASDVASARRMLDAGLPGRAAYYQERARTRAKRERTMGSNS